MTSSKTAITNNGATRYPLLEQILALKNLPLEPLYTISGAAQIFGISTRCIHLWLGSGRLTGRNLPGRWRFLTQDIEDFLAASGNGTR
jgi:hypothetical protein